MKFRTASVIVIPALTLMWAPPWTRIHVLSSASQLPPSIGASSPASAEASEAERTAQCKGLKMLIDGVKKDPDWMRQPYSDREVRDLEKKLASLNCSTEDPWVGTWEITGEAESGATRLVGTVILKRTLDVNEGRRLVDTNRPIACSENLEQRDRFYYGTLETKNSVTDFPFRRGTVFLCGSASGKDGNLLLGKFMDIAIGQFALELQRQSSSAFVGRLALGSQSSPEPWKLQGKKQ